MILCVKNEPGNGYGLELQAYYLDWRVQGTWASNSFKSLFLDDLFCKKALGKNPTPYD